MLSASTEVQQIFYATDGVWNLIIQLGIIAAVVLFANMLRRCVPVIRRTLMPVSVLAGFIMLALKLVLQHGFGIDDIFDIDVLDTLVYHCIALGFIAMSLRTSAKTDKNNSAAGVKSGAIIVGSYLIQGLTGLVLTILLSLTIKPGLFKAAGLLLPMGYGQGSVPPMNPLDSQAARASALPLLLPDISAPAPWVSSF